ncbi:MAG: hypothetical protein Q8O30_07060 [Candidatus Omnitrophota bacterium]|nr:hypothetical protein [Candidatus Omnitrophota bacterium]
MDAKKKEGIVVGVGYYSRQDWERFLASASDREKLEDTYDEWLELYHKTIRDMKAAGIEPRKVSFNLDELLEYCKKKRLKNNSEVRAKFFSELTKQGRSAKI